MRESDAAAHYDEAYFEWQRVQGEFGGWANLSKFEGEIRVTDTVLDFGCGGGYLLKALRCQQRLGVEINDSARAVARTNGVEAYRLTSELADACADVVVSDNALEHVTNPLAELRLLHKKLKPGGKIVVVVPCETVGMAYKAGDINYHLFSWGPMSLGNLLTEAGFAVAESRPYVHKWPPGARTIARLGRTSFDFAARIYARLERSWYQVRAVATKAPGS